MRFMMLSDFNPNSANEVSFRSAFAMFAALSGLALGIYFLNNPDTDLWVSGQIKGHVALLCSKLTVQGWCDDPFITGSRSLFIAVFIATGMLAAIGLFHKLWSNLELDGATQLRYLFLALVLAAGPGLVANLIFKDNWGRARPRTIQEFGGDKIYSPPLLVVKQCKRNCSFISGEAASTFTVGFAAAFLLPQLRFAMLAAGLIGGLLTGLIRILQGAHYLSDVLFAGVFMALAVAALHAIVFSGWLVQSRQRRPVYGSATNNQQPAFGSSPSVQAGA